MHLGAVVVAAVSVYLPWLRLQADSVNAMDTPSLFLIDYETTERGIELGMLVFIAAGIAFAALIVRTPIMLKVLLGVGVALIVMGVLFVIQVNRLFSAAGASLTDVLGLGPIVLLAAGAALVYVAVQLRKASSTSV